MEDAIKTGMNAVKMEEKTMLTPEPKSKMDHKTELYIENRGVTAACEEAAASIICKATSLPMETKLKYRDLIGKPTTNVLLPSGDRFSTKSLIGGNKHARNNQLSSGNASSGGSDTEVEVVHHRGILCYVSIFIPSTYFYTKKKHKFLFI